MNSHSLTSFDQEMITVRTLTAQMLGIAETGLSDVMQAIITRDCDSARQVLKQAISMKPLESTIENQVIGVIALRSPVADDLREILAIYKMTGMVARMGAFVRNISRRVLELDQCNYASTPVCIQTMGAECLTMLDLVSGAYIEQDAVKARKVTTLDESLDHLHKAVELEIADLMAADSQAIPALIHFLLIARYLERMGDLACDIASQVHYAVTGSQIDS